MSLNYKVCNNGAIPDYMCDPCDSFEKGRVRGAFFIHKSLKDAISTLVQGGTEKNIESKTWWETQITAGLIIVIPKIRGTYDGGTPNKVTGFGDKKEVVASKTHTVNYTDKNHTSNEEFYSALESSASDYLFGWRTNTELRVGLENIETVEVKDPVEEDTESVVTWQVSVVWHQSDKKIVPIYTLGDVKDVFECIDLEA